METNGINHAIFALQIRNEIHRQTNDLLDTVKLVMSLQSGRMGRKRWKRRRKTNVAILSGDMGVKKVG
ncbi:Uncharacterized protein BM_BM1279 [Brugia malayi]|uniref:Bm1279 n=1 Tax=Brugia malayi TaxID=6279 RepID=A0A0K0IVS9_BRUMA|nr:Uncharacterized protein BM_BM1279 [Brugia malayi]CDP94904.1 Bm1279 [Brugia malayi]VIO87042.1 Uncharacterized protein BM_BM1279 [Brugia malayi]